MEIVTFNKKLNEQVAAFQRYVINQYNKKFKEDFTLVESEITDLSLPESRVHNFIFIKSMFTDGKKEINWYSKLVPTDYSEAEIGITYIPIQHPPIQLDSSAFIYSTINGECFWQEGLKFFRKDW
jgi:hypothetical protein